MSNSCCDGGGCKECCRTPYEKRSKGVLCYKCYFDGGNWNENCDRSHQVCTIEGCIRFATITNILYCRYHCCWRQPCDTPTPEGECLCKNHEGFDPKPAKQ